MRPLKIISGGQTGADQGGLHGAVQIGIATGGTAPRGFKTELGPALWLKDYGLVEHSSEEYPPRTRANIKQSDGTVIFGTIERGSLLTYNECVRQGKPVLKAPLSVQQLRAFVDQNQIKVLNVAGNRESKNPGIHHQVMAFIAEAFMHEPRWEEQQDLHAGGHAE